MSEQKPNGNADDLNDLLDSEYALQIDAQLPDLRLI